MIVRNFAISCAVILVLTVTSKADDINRSKVSVALTLASTSMGLMSEKSLSEACNQETLKEYVAYSRLKSTTIEKKLLSENVLWYCYAKQNLNTVVHSHFVCENKKLKTIETITRRSLGKDMWEPFQKWNFEKNISYENILNNCSCVAENFQKAITCKLPKGHCKAESLRDKQADFSLYTKCCEDTSGLCFKNVENSINQLVQKVLSQPVIKTDSPRSAPTIPLVK